MRAEQTPRGLFASCLMLVAFFDRLHLGSWLCGGLGAILLFGMVAGLGLEALVALKERRSVGRAVLVTLALGAIAFIMIEIAVWWFMDYFPKNIQLFSVGGGI